MQEAEGAPAAGDRTGILRFPVGEQEATSALRFVCHRQGIFSALLDVLHPRPFFLRSCNTRPSLEAAGVAAALRTIRGA